MTVIYCILCFGGGFAFGVFATALIVFSGNREKRDGQGGCGRQD